MLTRFFFLFFSYAHEHIKRPTFFQKMFVMQFIFKDRYVVVYANREFSFQFRHYLYAEPGGSRRNYSELFGTVKNQCEIWEIFRQTSPSQIKPEPALLRKRIL